MSGWVIATGVVLVFIAVSLVLMFLLGARNPDEYDSTEPEIPRSGYEIAEDGRAIKCLKCEMVSWHPEDVRHRYCGNCHKFHGAENQGDE